MRAKAFLLLSLLLNVALIAAVLYTLRRAETPAPPLVASDQTSATNASPGRTQVILRKQFFSWSQIESEDYPSYIANLREIGCPESTIRDIIVADVNQLYTQKRAREVQAVDQPWWKSDPDWEAMKVVADKINSLDAERKALLTQLLGPEWDASEKLANVNTNGLVLGGPVLSQLSPETRQALQNINTRAQQRLSAYQEAQQRAGKSVDPAELSKLRRQTREELARVLSPQQLEDYLLRYSLTSMKMRQELAGFNSTPEEFRQVFRIRDVYEQQLQALASGDTTTTASRRKDLEQQRDNDIKQALGQERYRYYQMSQDPVFQQARTTAEQSGAPAELVMPIFQINQLALKEEQRIKNDLTLSSEEREKALASIRTDQQNSIKTLLEARSPRKTNAPVASDFPPLPGN